MPSATPRHHQRFVELFPECRRDFLSAECRILCHISRRLVHQTGYMRRVRVTSMVARVRRLDLASPGLAKNQGWRDSLPLRRVGQRLYLPPVKSSYLSQLSLAHSES